MVLGIKEGLAKCATVCVKSVVILMVVFCGMPAAGVIVDAVIV